VEGFSFWAQAIRWVARKRMEGDYRAQVYRDEGKGKVILDAFDKDGKPLNYLQFEGRALSPGQETVPIRLTQTDLGRYEAEFDIDEEGTYLVNLFESVGEEEGAGGVLSAGLSVPYSRSIPTTLQREPDAVAEITGGMHLLPPRSDHTLVAHAKPIPLWPWFLAWRSSFSGSTFLRRERVDWSDIRRAAVAYRLLFQKVELKSKHWTASRSEETALPKRCRKLTPLPPRNADSISMRRETETEDVDLSSPKAAKPLPPSESGPSKRIAPPNARASTTERLRDRKD
jgi:hypothetical protein